MKTDQIDELLKKWKKYSANINAQNLAEFKSCEIKNAELLERHKQYLEKRRIENAVFRSRLGLPYFPPYEPMAPRIMPNYRKATVEGFLDWLCEN